MLKSYSIVYDLYSPEQNYEKVEETIESWNVSRIKPMRTFWLVSTRMTAQEMVDSLKEKALSDNDRIFITELANDRAGWLHKDNWSFINDVIY